MTPTLRVVDPSRLADLTLAAALRSSSDAVYLEPGKTDDSFLITFQRAQQNVAAISVEALSGAATIARLALIAGLDLASPTAASAVIKVRSGDRDADVVVTVRPGAGSLRADLMVMAKAPRGMPAPRTTITAAAQVTGEPGDVVGNYKILERLGEGGMGTVFRVEHAVLGRHYALKVLRSQVVEKAATAAQRFVREARAAARVRHPNIVDVFDFGYFPDGRPFFVMELCEGQSLLEYVRRQGPLPPSDAIAIARQIALALAQVHDHGVIHSDVTPSNVLVVGTRPLEVKLLDFGLAAIADELFEDENSDFVLGTPAYISPEQLHGLPATDRSDQYGLGCVLYEMLVGHPPYQHENVRELCMMHIQAPIPVAESMYGPLPAKLTNAIATCLQKSPQARFPGLRALIAVLDDIDRGNDRRGWQKWLNT
ncbi:MAG TPA: serine/threonine-protein kinase [Kofleriaceae bacterium]|nr:serine/threonine-protein kinase [Kofleriaceae bacterium]